MKIGRAGFALACDASRVLLRDSLSDLISADGHRVNPCQARIVRSQAQDQSLGNCVMVGCEPYRSRSGVALELDAWAVLRPRNFGQAPCSDDSGSPWRRGRGRVVDVKSDEGNGREQGWTSWAQRYAYGRRLLERMALRRGCHETTFRTCDGRMELTVKCGPEAP